LQLDGAGRPRSPSGGARAGSERAPSTSVIDLPFLTESADAATRTLWALFPDYLEEEYQGLHVLALHAHNGGLIHTRNDRSGAADGSHPPPARASAQMNNLLRSHIWVAQKLPPVSSRPGRDAPALAGGYGIRQKLQDALATAGWSEANCPPSAGAWRHASALAAVPDPYTTSPPRRNHRQEDHHKLPERVYGQPTRSCPSTVLMASSGPLMRIPTKPAGDSDLKAAAIPI
jgi:hypothetical protein